MFSFVSALIFSLTLIPLVRRISLRLGQVAQPRSDRWHKTPTPVLGGVGIFAAFILSLLLGRQFAIGWDGSHWGLLAGSALMFGLGLYDDVRPVSPPVKLIGQILAGTLVISQGYTTDFFSPRIENQILAQLPNIVLTFIWLVGITNAINLLDNMDGLAGGITFITAGFLAYFFWQAGDTSLLMVSLALAGSVLGFLVFNFPPASIFMGDSGSLFLGFTLAVLAIARQPQASNVFAVMGVPTLLFLLPILDTVLVTFTRILRGSSPTQGGQDHTSHRLIAFGLSERQVVVSLYIVAIVSGVIAATLEAIRYWFSLVLAPALMVLLALVMAYLGRIKVGVSQAEFDSGNDPAQIDDKRFVRIMLDLTLRRRLLEVVLDFFLIGIAYYLAFLTNFGIRMNAIRLEMYLATLPFALGAAYLTFSVLGVYRGVWRYVDFGDLARYFQAALGSLALLAAAVYMLTGLGWIVPVESYPPAIFIFFGGYLFLGLAASRSSFKLLDWLFARQAQRTSSQRVVIFGAGDAGEMALRWILMNADLDYQVVGILDSDPYLRGRQIHGVRVIGGLNALARLLSRHPGIDGVILAGIDRASPEGEQILKICQPANCWVRSLGMDFEDVQG